MIEARLTGRARKGWETHIEAIIEKARDFLDEHPHTSIDMEELARNLHVGYSWFRRMFKQLTGESPNHYHLNRRIGRLLRFFSGRQRAHLQCIQRFQNLHLHHEAEQRNLEQAGAGTVFE